MNRRTVSFLRRCRPVVLATIALNILLLTSQNALALDPKKSISQYVHKLWTTDNGLPENAVAAIVQTKDGYLWLATQEGLARFDGVQFTIFDKSNSPGLGFSNIADMKKDQEENLWLAPAQPKGVARFKDGTFTTYTTKEGLAANFLRDMVVDPRGGVWFATLSGVSKFSGDKFTTLTMKDGLVSDSVMAAYVAPSGDVWFSTLHGISLYKNGSFTNYTTKEGLLDDRAFERVLNEPNRSTILEDKNGTVWIGTPKGLNRLEGGKFTSYTTKEGLSNNDVTFLLEDKKGDLWIGTKDGLNRMENGHPVIYRSNDPKTNNIVAGLFEDRDGSLWIRTVFGGLKRLRSGTFEIYTMRDGLSDNNVYTMHEDHEGSLWLGLQTAGLERWSDGKFTTYTRLNGLPNDMIWTVLQDRSGTLWIGTTEGLVQMRDGKTKVFTTHDGLPDNTIQSICQDSSSEIWVGTATGLSRYRNGKFQPLGARDGFPPFGRRVSLLFTDSRGDVWIENPNNPGVYRYHDGKFSLIGAAQGVNGLVRNVSEDDGFWLATSNGVYRLKGDSVVAHITTAEGLSSNITWSTFVDRDGVVWVATNGDGVNRIKNGTVTPIHAKDGLYDELAFAFLEDDLGYFWMSCNKGVYRVSKKELNDFCDGKIRSVTSIAYGTADGMMSRECNGGVTPDGWKMKDGRLCFVTVKGLAMVNPADIKINPIPPFVNIEQATADGTPLDRKGSSEFAPGTDRFEFHYTGLSFVGSEQVQFKYKLDGYDKDWVDAGTRREAFYTNIPHGAYSFTVLARNSDGIWNETGASLGFRLLPHFYQTFWFYALAFLFFAVVGPTVYFLRVRQLKRRQMELVSMVREKTKELQAEKDKTEGALVQTEAAKVEAERNRAQAETALKGLQEAQKQLVLSEKMASLGQLTAGIAHEIKNPLNFVTNFAVLSTDLVGELREELQLHREDIDRAAATNIEEILASLEQNVTKINEHGKRADSIVKGMLLHSRGKPGERQPTDVNALLAEYVNLAYHGMRAQDHSFNIKIETDLDPAVGVMNVVPQDLSRAFLNIVNNGCYAANERKKVQGNGVMPTIRVTSKSVGDCVEVRIRDNGTGIPKHIADRIFNPFFTTKPAGVGTGLGLSLTYDIIVQEHKGSITVDSKEGEYTEFLISLPRNPS